MIVTQQGKGSWVNGTLDLKEIQREELRQHLEQASKLAKSLAMSQDELLDMMKKYI
jgi:GntR family transcriptional regulator